MLGADKQDALIDLCGKLPPMQQQALTPQHIRAGFMRSGMISADGDTPDLHAIYKTHKGDYSPEEVHLLHTTLVPFLKISQEFGYIPKVEFDKAGYQLDQTPDGADFLRDKDISQEGQMRARSLGHSFARAQCEFMRGAVLRALTDKSLKETDEVKVVLLRSKAALDQVLTPVKIRLGVCAFLPKKGERCEVWVEEDWWMARVVKKIIDKKMVFRYTHPNGVSFGSEESLKVGANNVQAFTGAHEDVDEHEGAGGAVHAAEGEGGDVDEADEIEQESTRDKEFVAQHPDWVQNLVRVQDFDNVRQVEMLTNFVQARSSNTLKATPTSNLPGRGSVAKAELSEDCLLLRAYQMRIQPEILEALELLLPAPRRIINPSVLDFSVKPREPRLEPHDIKQPSSFLHNAERVANMTASISGRAAAFLITEAHIAQADALMPIIFARLEQHISLKVKVDH